MSSGDRRIRGMEPDESYPDNSIRNYKYTLVTFLPLNLKLQFSRFMNQYFLCIGLLQLWPAITPVNPITTLAPLAFIFTVSAVREALDDFSRHRSDKAANSRKVTVARGGRWTTQACRDIRVGDVVLVREDEEIPADLVLVASSEENGMCHIQTANLDGESDLKPRNAAVRLREPGQPPLEGEFSLVRPESCDAVPSSPAASLEVSAPPPSAEVYRFDASVTVSGAGFGTSTSSPLPLSSENLLPQATHLRNASWCAGIAVYTGNETKIGMNKREVPTKWTRLDVFINRVTMAIFAFQLCTVVVLGAVGNHWKSVVGEKITYLEYPLNEPWYAPIVIPLRFLLLCSVMIPISLKVSMDIVKYAYAMFIGWDEEMRHVDPESDHHGYAVANSTSLAEDLGSIRHVMTDKTGTLTENVMRLHSVAARGRLYSPPPTGSASNTTSNSATPGPPSGSKGPVLDPALYAAVSDRDPGVCALLRCLAVCNNVMVARDADEEIGDQAIGENASAQAHVPHHHKYRASSPDEEALVLACAALGFPLVTRDGPRVVIGDAELGTERKYSELASLAFTSDRKRMSVLVRDEHDGSNWLFMKGADDVIAARTAEANTEEYPSNTPHLESLARLGLRTLSVAHRRVPDDEAQEWIRDFKEASVKTSGRDAALESAYDRIERSVEPIGITAIEDKLQDGVPETIRHLRDAGIVFWMLTGDKKTTAIEIAKSCKLTTPEPNGRLISIDGEDAAAVGRSLDAAFEQVSASRGTTECSIILEGPVLRFALAHHAARLLETGLMCTSVICCRVTPAQKAGVVAIVKSGGSTVLAIGDGGNDVSMIQEAHVGVGLRGREGLQAARSADYSLNRFRFLSRLLLVHGHLSLRRSSLLAQYSFYKSVVISVVQLGFAFYSGFSGASFFNTFSLTTYNVIFTGAPILAVAVQDQHVSARTLMAIAEAYGSAQRSEYMNPRTVAGWGVAAFWQGAALLGVTAGVYGSSLTSIGDPEDQGSTSIALFSALVLQQTIVVMLECRRVTAVVWWVVLSTLGALVAAVVLINTVVSFGMFYEAYHLLREPFAWFTALLTVVVAVAPYVAVKYVRQEYFARPHDDFAKMEHLQYGSSFSGAKTTDGMNRADDRHGQFGSSPQAAAVRRREGRSLLEGSRDSDDEPMVASQIP